MPIFNMVQDEQIIQERKKMMKRYGPWRLLLLSLFWVLGSSQAHPRNWRFEIGVVLSDNLHDTCCATTGFSTDC